MPNRSLPRLPFLASLALLLSAPFGPASAVTAWSPPATVPAAWQRADAATEARASEWMRSQASGWTPNRGQIADASGRPATNVLFSTTRPGAQVFVTTTGMSHFFLVRQGKEGVDEERRGPGQRRKERQVEWTRVDLALEGARIRPERARTGATLADRGRSDYYLAHCPDGVLDVAVHDAVTFPEVYPGIDWVVRSSPDDGVHHEFLVQPGADPAGIRLAYSGASAIELSEDRRTLRLHTRLGVVHEGALACFQDGGRLPVGARFVLEGSVVRVQLDDYDRSKPLVIDPPLAWSTYYGGSSFDGPRAIYCDNANNFVYIVGYTNSTNLPLLNPGGTAYFEGVAPAAQDAFLWKFDQQGARLWATYYGGTGLDFLADCAVDAAGNLYAAGYTMSTDLPTLSLGGAYNQAVSGGGTDAFLLKFSAGGVRQWATYYGGSGTDYINGITTDAAGKLYGVGSSSSGASLVLANPGGGSYFQPSPASPLDGLILRFGAGGSLEWGTFFGGSDNYEDLGGVTTAGGNLYATGYTMSPDFPTLDPGGGAYYEGTLQGGADAVVARFTLAGVQTWTTYYGGSTSESADEPAVDANGNLFVFGDTYSTDFPVLDPGGGAWYQPAVAGDGDFFLLKFDAANARTWATLFGGAQLEMTGFSDQPLTVDAQGNVYVTGLTLSADLPVLNPGGGSFYDSTANGDRDAMIAQFSNSGVLLWSTYFGSDLLDFGCGLSIGLGGCLFATGEVTGATGFTTVNPGLPAWFQPASSGDHEGYIAKFCAPNSACCIDFTCVPVSSQAQCTALGGTQFHPNQTCPNVTCTIDCTICGRKFSDLNRNGVQDGGEPGLAGWTIALYYPNGPLYGTTVTDANGDYCFTGLPCGPWTVTEVQQPGWVQTAPAGVHSVTLNTGSTQNGVNFANFACATTLPCIGMPPGLAAWWPFNDGPGATTAADVTHATPGRNAALVTSAGGGSVPDLLCFASPADRATVPAAEQMDLDFGAGSFAIAAWMNPSSSGGGPRPVVDKRSSSTAGTSGWALSLDGLQCLLELATGGTPQLVPGPVVTPDTWTHVAVSIDRNAGEGRWYLNGDPVATFDFVPAAGAVSNDADLVIGQVGPAFGGSPGFQGCLADLALFSEPLTPAAARKAYDPTPVGWCPEYALLPKVKSFCRSDSSVQVCFNLVNNTASPQTYQWSMAGLPAGPGCVVAGPAQIFPSAGTVTVPAGGTSVPICVAIRRPAGLVAQNATACYALTFMNTATGVCRTKTATLRADNSCWCANPIPQGVVRVPGRLVAGAIIGVPIENPCDPVASVQYVVQAEWLDADHADPQVLSLNGLPPGTPVTGTAVAGSRIDIQVGYPGGYDPGARYEITVSADTDSDGSLETLSGTIVQAAYDSAGPVAVPVAPDPARSARLVARPNPFVGGSTIEFALAQSEVVSLGVYDLGGRLVRSLARGRLAAGAHRFPWDGRDARGGPVPAGVYFVRLAGGGRPLEAMVVKVR